MKEVHSTTLLGVWIIGIGRRQTPDHVFERARKTYTGKIQYSWNYQTKMNPPRLEENKCSILIAELATGHVFKKDLTLFLNGQHENEVFQVFETVQSAKNFALDFIAKAPEFECSIFDNKGEHLAIFDKHGERNITQ